MTSPDEILEHFGAAAAAQRAALGTLTRSDRRRRTERAGQYHLDTIAEAAILPELAPLRARILSEEAGWLGPADAALTLVLDPVDGSTNCARELPYWGISVAAIDADGLLCALVENGATGTVHTAVRGEGAWRDGVRMRAAATTTIDRAVVATSALPPRDLGWRQYRSLGSAALMLCDLAAGNLDGYLDIVEHQLCPWDYLGALLVCGEAGAHVRDRQGRELVIADADARRQLVGAATPELLDVLLVADLAHPGREPE